MGTAARTMRTVILPAALVLAASGASAAGSAGWARDQPLRTLTLPDGEGGEASCTVYRDLAVRVPGTDTPAPGDAVLLRGAGAACAGDDVRLATAGFDLVGRTGAYLVFEQSDPLGATGFRVVDSRSGRAIVDDASIGGITGANALRLTAGPTSLVLRYRRGLNTDCSLLERPAACWRRITRDPANRVPADIARLVPPVAACRRSYRVGSVPHDDPSVVAYDVELRWSHGAGLRTRAAGPIGCTPLP